MNITRTNDNGSITLALDGWLDTASAPELAAQIDAIDSASAIVLDFGDVEYIASSGIRQVVACNKRAKELGAEFSVINVGSDVMSIFQLTGLDKKLAIKGRE